MNITQSSLAVSTIVFCALLSSFLPYFSVVIIGVLCYGLLCTLFVGDFFLLVFSGVCVILREVKTIHNIIKT